MKGNRAKQQHTAHAGRQTQGQEVDNYTTNHLPPLPQQQQTDDGRWCSYQIDVRTHGQRRARKRISEIKTNPRQKRKR